MPQTSSSLPSSSQKPVSGSGKSPGQPGSSQSTDGKRKLDSTTSSSQQQKKAKQDASHPQTTHSAQNIATGSGSTPGDTSSGTHQVDTPSGPDHNTKGSVQGESGNRKIQQSLLIFDTKVCLHLKILSVI